MITKEVALYSMTGYGRGAVAGVSLRATVELRSVNGRFLEIRSKLPRFLLPLEPELRAQIELRLGRGMIDFTVHVQSVEGFCSVAVDQGAVSAYVEQAERLAKEFGIASGLSALAVLRMPGAVLADEPALPDQTGEAAELVKSALEQAMASLVEMRRREGEKLGIVLQRELSEIRGHKDWLRKNREELNEKHLRRLETRISEWIGKSKGTLEETRLYQELAFYLDRSDVTEELDRLSSHLKQCEEALRSPGNKSVGKRLEFLAQELGREVNTIGAKSDAAQVTNHVVEMKLTLEKFREQVQNLE